MSHDPDPADTDEEGLLDRTSPGDAVGIVCGLAARYWIFDYAAGDWREITRICSIGLCVLTLLAMVLSRSRRFGELGRALGVTASALWSQIVEAQFALDEFRFRFSEWAAIFTAGHLFLAYVTLSPLVLLKGLFSVAAFLVLKIAELGNPPEFLPLCFRSLLFLGVVYLLVARLHLPRGFLTVMAEVRFARTYQLAGFVLINWITCAVSWVGWNADAYEHVHTRLMAVTLAIGLYSMEVWVGRRQKARWLTTLGLQQFIVQCVLLLVYPFISIASRAVIVIFLALVLINITREPVPPAGPE